MNFNQLTLAGFIGRAATTKTINSGRPVTSFSLATKESWKDAEGQWQEETTWHNIVAYGEGFAKLADRLTKGAHVLVQGRLNSGSYEREIETTHNKKTIKVKAKQNFCECIADTIRLLDRKSQEDTAPEPEASE